MKLLNLSKKIKTVYKRIFYLIIESVIYAFKYIFFLLDTFWVLKLKFIRLL